METKWMRIKYLILTQNLTSAILTEDINEPNSGMFDLRDQYGVPVPARYQEPSTLEISLTQPIPDYIVSNCSKINSR